MGAVGPPCHRDAREHGRAKGTQSVEGGNGCKHGDMVILGGRGLFYLLYFTRAGVKTW